MDYATIIGLAAKKVGISGALLLAVCVHESGLKNITNEFDHGSPSIGVCQLKKKTAEMLGFKGNRIALENPATNIWWAAKYLKWQLERYDGNACKAISAYNSGSYHESKKKPGYPRNLKYVKSIKNLISDKNIAMLLECGGFESKFAGGF